ncbi:hypothetical protein LOTGIDRAFT_121608 [Lottia gigantea]|uniref:Uncharacterized protein n=1 Tax=Lottia gigantea TaxID=225164 RepID=V4AF47_LOTGI|nr:hypothetical protein LOTGIDRAFT_121608 [Lottia gigantea]ESO91951.1 hypothetical protein LOTGIDRAFT_121608 [Lottia gigantea]
MLLLFQPILYSYFRSSCSWRVRIALNIKGIEYEYKAVHLLNNGGEQRSEDYSSKNPMQQVPSLETSNGDVLTQSLPIMEYLEEQYPSPSLLPKDSIQRAQIRALAEMINSGIQPLQNLTVLQYLKEDQKAEWSKHWIHNGFVALEKTLEKTSGKYCFGDNITLVDCCLPPQVFNANRFKVDMAEFPVISRINEDLGKIEAFKLAQPSQQPDCPSDLK